jgi:hypothetical protein
MKITSDLTNLTTAILILTVQMFIEWTLCIKGINLGLKFERQCRGHQTLEIFFQ